MLNIPIRTSINFGSKRIFRIISFQIRGERIIQLSNGFRQDDLTYSSPKMPTTRHIPKHSETVFFTPAPNNILNGNLTFPP